STTVDGSELCTVEAKREDGGCPTRRAEAVRPTPGCCAPGCPARRGPARPTARTWSERHAPVRIRARAQPTVGKNDDRAETTGDAPRPPSHAAVPGAGRGWTVPGA